MSVLFPHSVCMKPEFIHIHSLWAADVTCHSIQGIPPYTASVHLICIQIQGLAKQQKIMLFLNKHFNVNAGGVWFCNLTLYLWVMLRLPA